MTAIQFDAFADAYQRSVERSTGFTGRNLEFFHRRKIEMLIRLGRRHLGTLRSASVLDVGCGVGITDNMLRPHVGSLHGVDVSAAMVEQAGRRNPDCIYQAYDGECLPFADSTFDLVMTICVVHHVPPHQWEAFTSELVRVTRPGGLVTIIEHNRLNPLTRRAVSTCEFDEDAVLVPQRRIARLLDKAGAGPVETRHFLFSPLGGRVGAEIDHVLAAFPLGGQYVSAARRRVECAPRARDPKAGGAASIGLVTTR